MIYIHTAAHTYSWLVLLRARKRRRGGVQVVQARPPIARATAEQIMECALQLAPGSEHDAVAAFLVQGTRATTTTTLRTLGTLRTLCCRHPCIHVVPETLWHSHTKHAPQGFQTAIRWRRART
eukprot:COSAG05_NODE_497_length_9246_cov_6.935343_10_plen_123_part_00